jgi:cellobiose phosphorylase
MAFAHAGNAGKAWELFDLINPVKHADTAAKANVYKVEPYVMAADVYSVAPHTGRGGWTWYTGSAGWMYRLILESLLGMRREDDRLFLEPLMPEQWPGFTVQYRYLETKYVIKISRPIGQPPGEPALPAAPAGLSLDGIRQAAGFIQLADDRQEHRIELLLAPKQTPAAEENQTQES